MLPKSPKTPTRSERIAAIKARPAYTIAEASRFLHLPSSTVASWVKGRDYGVIQDRGPRTFLPAIVPAGAEGKTILSFENLVEMHVLSSLRRVHALPLPRIRQAMSFLREIWGTDHPLAHQDIFTDKKSVFVAAADNFLNANESGQAAFGPVLESFLARIDRDDHDVPFRLYPFFRRDGDWRPKVVAIDPMLRFGQPYVVSVTVSTDAIASRVRAGEVVEDVAEDFGCSVDDVRDAVAFEERNSAA